MLRLGLAGDVMLGRLVDRYVLADPARGPGFVWGDTLSLWAQMDLRMVNLECVIAATGEPWIPKAFQFRARPGAVDVLRSAGIHLVSVANNHVLDYGYDALRACLSLLGHTSIRSAGAGLTLHEAAAPTTVSVDRCSVAVIGLADGEPEWEAAPDRPGINYVRCDHTGLHAPYRQRVEDALARARDAAPFVIVSAHVGPNWGPPTPHMRALAHEVIDLGADLYWGHSNHTVQGIEIYRGRPILYASGDFVDDYAVDPQRRNDLSCFFDLAVDTGRVTCIRLHPVRIARCQVNLAAGEDLRWLHGWLRERMAECGTTLGFDGGVGVVNIAD